MKRLTVYECIRQHGREVVWINKVDEDTHCIDVKTERAYDIFEMDGVVKKWWYEPENCLCLLIR